MNLMSYRSYPQEVYDIILAYHFNFPPSRSGPYKGGNTRFLDLGCGPGFVASTLAPHFEHTLGLDPSKKMVDIGLQPVRGEKVEYRVGNAEDLDSAGVGVGDQGVDLVVAGTFSLIPIPSVSFSLLLTFFSYVFLTATCNGQTDKWWGRIGQAAHWFDHSKVWSQLTKHVRPGGTVAYLVGPPNFLYLFSLTNPLALFFFFPFPHLAAPLPFLPGNLNSTK